MPMTIDVKEAEARFEELITQVEAGEEIVICRDGAPVAKLTAFDAEARRVPIEDAGALAKPATAEELIAWKNQGRRY